MEQVSLRPHRWLRRRKCPQFQRHRRYLILTLVIQQPPSIFRLPFGIQDKFNGAWMLLPHPQTWRVQPIHNSSAMPVTNSNNGRHGFRPRRCISAPSNRLDLAESPRRICRIIFIRPYIKPPFNPIYQSLSALHFAQQCGAADYNGGGSPS